MESCGIFVDKVMLGQVFSEYFGLPRKFSFYQMLHTHLSSGAGAMGQLVSCVPSGPILVPHHDDTNQKVNITFKRVLYIKIVILIQQDT
jgi:hypothetical protein